MTILGHFSDWSLKNWPGKSGRFRAKSQEIKVVGNAILKAVYSIIFFLGCILQPQMTAKNDQFRTFFRMVPQKLAICSKRGHFRAKIHFIKVVGNAILKTFYLMTFFLGSIPQPEKPVEVGLYLLILSLYSFQLKIHKKFF